MYENYAQIFIKGVFNMLNADIGQDMKKNSLKIEPLIKYEKLCINSTNGCFRQPHYSYTDSFIIINAKFFGCVLTFISLWSAVFLYVFIV